MCLKTLNNRVNVYVPKLYVLNTSNILTPIILTLIGPAISILQMCGISRILLGSGAQPQNGQELV